MRRKLSNTSAQQRAPMGGFALPYGTFKLRTGDRENVFYFRGSGSDLFSNQGSGSSSIKCRIQVRMGFIKCLNRSNRSIAALFMVSIRAYRRFAANIRRNRIRNYRLRTLRSLRNFLFFVSRGMSHRRISNRVRRTAFRTGSKHDSKIIVISSVRMCS